MSFGIVSDRKTSGFGKNRIIENCQMGADDIDWCSGFWNEMAGEMTPSLYPDSPIFSSNEYDWNDPVFIENVFITPDVEETFAGTRLSGRPVFMENSFEENEDNYSEYSNSCKPDSILQVGQPSNTLKQKNKRSRKPKNENAQESSSKRQKTSSTKKTKPKAKK